ncbi:hypothetical protein [Candidatus Uabimicrobium sp. HlEnr_7]|uniref:hypothetical protein n=1 Tax=Candidatus Uabimicrobium helgolandensis TaxID=3095367 RepID=UPI0035576F58
MKNIKPYQLLNFDLLHDESSVYEKVNQCCQHIENLIQFNGIVATALYRNSTIRKEALDHAIFMSFEKSFFGSWLYLARKIGEFFYDNDYTQTHFSEWISFLQQYAYDKELISLSSDLLQFRNDVRHGSAAQNPNFVKKIVKKIEVFHSKYFIFLTNYPLCLSIDQETYQIDYSGKSEKISVNFVAALCDKKTKQYLDIFPFASWDNKNQILVLHNAPKNKRQFYSNFGIEDRYDEFLQQKEGINQQSTTHEIQFTNCVFDKINTAIKNNKNKIVVWAPPGGGKTYVAQNINHGKSCHYVIEESPLKIRTSTALKTFCRTLYQKMQKPIEVKNKKIEQLIASLKSLAQEFPDEKFTIVVDGLFSVFVKEWWQKQWLSILNQDYPQNLVWIITACPGEPVPPFYSADINIPLIDVNSLCKNFPKHDAQKIMSYTLGYPKFVWFYVKYGENSILQQRYFSKWLRYYNPDEKQQEVLKLLAQTPTYLSPKEIAATLQIFTPKVERFLGEIDILMDEKQRSYTTYHPALASHLKG